MKMVAFRTSLCAVFLVVSLVEGKLQGSFSPNRERSLVFVEERFPCVDFNTPSVQAATGKENVPLYSPECDNNTCNNGCCRFHSAVLTCDTDNDFPHLKCICNQNTQTASPTLAPSSEPTPEPSSEPSSLPTTEDRTGEGGGGGIDVGTGGGSCGNYFDPCTVDDDCCPNRQCTGGMCRSIPKTSKGKLGAADDRDGPRGGAAGLAASKNGGGEVGIGGGGRKRRRVRGS